MPYASAYHEDWRNEPLYDDEGKRDDGPHFFERWYDEDRLAQLLAAAPSLSKVDQSIVSLDPDLHKAYTRHFPWLIPLGPLFGLLARERTGPDGYVVRLTLVKAS
jgi:hypothetical protein